jgi:cysteine desulfurase
MAEAIRRHGTPDEAEIRRQFAWTEKLARELAGLGGVRRHGHTQHRVANTLNLGFDGLDGEELLIGLDLAGLAVSSGSACLVGSVQPSHVLAAMGLLTDTPAATVRFSIGREILDRDLPEIVRRIREVVQTQRAVRGWKESSVAALQEAAS